MRAAAGIVMTQAITICCATFQRTAEARRAAPTPTMAPVIVWVVDTGICLHLKGEYLARGFRHSCSAIEEFAKGLCALNQSRRVTVVQIEEAVLARHVGLKPAEHEVPSEGEIRTL